MLQSFARISLCLLLVVAGGSMVDGQPSMMVTRLASFSRPVVVTTAPGDPDRLFVVLQGSSTTLISRIRIFNLETGTTNPENFLSISDVACCNERGLLGMAFHPDYETNGLFYVNFTSSVDEHGNSDLITMIREYKRLTPDLADPNSGRTLLAIDQPGINHNGGWMGFGPDGYLYVATGDGQNPPGNQNNAQTIEDNLLGKILRIDPLGNNSSNGQYGLPSDNPFVGTQGDDEIWAYGLRNPWRCSFDRQTGDLYIADVGGVEREEVNVQPADSSGGQNYGWKVREGTIGPKLPGAIDPFYEYAHTGSQAVIGGYVYRGPILDVQGHYFFADNRSDRLWSLKWDGTPQSEHDGTNFTDYFDWTNIVKADGGSFRTFSTFGEDSEGNLYIVSLDGDIYRLAWASPTRTPNRANSVAIFRGANIGGDLTSTYLSDDRYMRFSEGPILLPNDVAISLVFDGVLPSDSPSEHQIVLESQASTIGLANTVETWNWTTNSYDVVDQSAATSGIDSVRLIDLSSSNRQYVQDGSGAVRARLSWRRSGTIAIFPWEVKIDQMVWMTQ
jgi:glucose/arabinose dehydrogenase